jgi:hypothetical protein
MEPWNAAQIPTQDATSTCTNKQVLRDTEPCMIAGSVPLSNAENISLIRDVHMRLDFTISPTCLEY